MSKGGGKEGHVTISNFGLAGFVHISDEGVCWGGAWGAKSGRLVPERIGPGEGGQIVHLRWLVLAKQKHSTSRVLRGPLVSCEGKAFFNVVDTISYRGIRNGWMGP